MSQEYYICLSYLEPDLEVLGLRKLLKGILSTRALDQMLKGSRMLDTRGERLKVPQVAEGAQNRRRRVRDRLPVVVGALLLNSTLADPGGDKEGGDTATETVEGEGVVLAVGGLESESEVVGAGGQRRRDVVVETTALVEGKDEESVVPLWACAEGVVDGLDEVLTVGDKAGGVHGGGSDAAAGRVEVGEFGEVALGSVVVEVRQGHDLVVVTGLVGPVEEAGVGASATVGVDVVHPGVAGLGELLEERAVGELVVVEALIIKTVAV